MRITHITESTVRDSKVVASLQRGMKNGKTLVFVHAEWCPYTVSFYPVWNEFEDAHKHVKDLKVFKIDHNAISKLHASKRNLYNAIGDLDMNTETYKVYFPTVVMFVDGARKKYSPETRTLKNLSAFVKKGMSTPTSTASASAKVVETTTKSKAVPHDKSKKLVKDTTKVHKTLQQEIDDAFSRLFKR